MKKILHISKYYYPYAGGTEQTARDIVLALKGKYKQKVICFGMKKQDETCIVDDIQIVKCGCLTKIASQSISLSYKKNLVEILNGFSPDVVILHYPNPFVTTFLLKMLSPKIKLIVYWHLDIVKQKLSKYLFFRQNKKLLARANKVICTSPNYIKGSVWLQSVKHKCLVVPSCISEERMECTPKVIENAKAIKNENVGKTICVAVGRHTEYKGFEYLIKASKYLDDKFMIYITGTGELTSELKKEAADDEKIVFTGKIDDEKLKSLLYASDIFCFPSITKNEAFGLALAEAMYYEKPAVTFNIPGSGVNYVCINGINGIEVPNRDVIAYANAMKRLASDRTLREQYGKAGKERVVNNFLSSQYYKNINDVISSVCNLQDEEVEI